VFVLRSTASFAAMDEVYKGFVVNTTRIEKYLIYF